jgi:hypothetical protein
MTNIFKSNSRFSALLDETKDIKRDKDREKESKNKFNKVEQSQSSNSFKSSEKKEGRFKPYDERDREKERLQKQTEINLQKELKKKEKEQLVLEALNINNFPELISVNKKENDEKPNTSYVDMLKKEEKIQDFDGDPDLVNLKPGWLLMKKDRQSGNTIIKRTILYEEPKSSEKEIILEMVDALVQLHEKRTEEYIELNGYDVWEKMFKYPNWEEREAYLEEEEEIDDTSDENEDEYHEYDEHDDDYYDEYYDGY